MIRRFAAALAALTLSACAAHVTPQVPVAVPIEIQILAFNDFHGNLQTPPPVEVTEADGTKHKIVTGGAAHLAAALAGLRVGHANTITVSAGDTIGASPLISANYLDEPTIAAMNLLHLEVNSVGNHEFDRGSDELKRMQAGHSQPSSSGRGSRAKRAFFRFRRPFQVSAEPVRAVRVGRTQSNMSMPAAITSRMPSGSPIPMK